MSSLLFIVVLIVIYLIAAIPSGIVLAKVMGYEDVRGKGSGNIGATNVLRTGNKAAALATLLLDAAKGGIAVLIARLALGEDAATCAVNVVGSVALDDGAIEQQAVFVVVNATAIYGRIRQNPRTRNS